MNKEEYKRLLKKKREQRRRKRILAAVAVLGVVVASILLYGFVTGIWTGFDALQGTWKYDAYTTYEFDGKGNGCLCVENLHYDYTYTISDNKVMLDFSDTAVRDCSYTFTVTEDLLVIIGGEGTIGGTYELVKQ